MTGADDLFPRPSDGDAPREDQDREAIHSELFKDFVAQQGQLALVLLGKMPSPETRETLTPDPEAAKPLIDQLEMLRHKTRGNLLPEELDLLDRGVRVLQREFAAVMEGRANRSV